MKNKWITVTEYQVVNPSGGNGIYGKVHFKNTALGIVALDHDLNTWLVGQYRYTLNEWSWEIPEGHDWPCQTPSPCFIASGFQKIFGKVRSQHEFFYPSRKNN